MAEMISFGNFLHRCADSKTLALFWTIRISKSLCWAHPAPRTR